MRRRAFRSNTLKQLLMLLVIPLTLTSTGYALFSQNLGLSGTGAKPAYTATQNMRVSYDVSRSPSGNRTKYTVTPITVSNLGNETTTSWRLLFDAPGSVTQLSCDAVVSCSLSGSTVTIESTASSQALAPGNSITFSVNFLSDAANSNLQNINISAMLALVYQTRAGLTVSAAPGTRTKSGKWWNVPHTFTVTNNSGLAIRSWRITANWSSSTNQVVSMDTTVNYTTSPTQLTMTSITGMSNSTTFQFSGTLGSTSNSWTLTGLSIQGAV